MKLRALLTRIYSQPRSWLGAVAHRGRLEDEMEAELACHLENLTEELIRSGLSPGEARRRARIAMGSMLTSKEEMRGSLGLGWWDALWADLRYAVRILGKSPGFTAIAVISLALAIGANTTIFSVAKQLLYDRLNVPNSADLRLLAWTAKRDVAVHSTWGDWDESDGRVASSVFSYPVFRQLRAENRVLADLFAFKDTDMNAIIQGAAQRVQAEMVSGNYYSELGVRPVLGRGITPTDDAKPGQGAVAVISYGLWEREFDRSPSVLGLTIRANDIPLTIVGVNPKEFTSAQDVQRATDLVVPLSMQPIVSPMPGNKVQPLFDPDLSWVNIMARTKPGVNDQAAQAALDTQLAAAVRGTMTVKKGEDVPHLDLHDGSRGLFAERSQFGKPLAVLMTMVGLVLLLACANIANLMLVRGARRQREMSVRLALGAGRTRILRQMLVESLLLAIAGGAFGLLFGYLGRNAIPRMLEDAWERSSVQVHFDWGVFAFTATITIATGVLFGLAPALAAAHADLGPGLKAAALAVTRRRKGLSSRALVSFQIALSTLLVISAGLFVRTLIGLKAVDLGFRTDHLLLLEINPELNHYPPGKDVELHRKLVEAFATVPGVESVAPAAIVYISNSRWSQDFVVEGKDQHTTNLHVVYNSVGNKFFETLGIPILAGRAFQSKDTATSLKVGVINQSLARKAFPNRNPIGKRFAMNGSTDGTDKKVWIEIVGVCADTRYSDVRSAPPPQAIVPFVQMASAGGMAYEIRTQMTSEALVSTLRQVAQRIAPDLPLSNVRTQDQQIDSVMQQERVFVTLTSGFGLLALALASVGIYGVLAYSVAQRTNEIGVRLAVGAQPWQVRALVLKESTWLAGAGIVVGTVAAFGLCRLVRSMLYGIRPDDPATMIAGVLILLSVALAASWIPARRAARLDPMEALRHE